MSAPVDRNHIGIFGKMNSGKSTVMNLLLQQPASLVDETPGTTADTRVLNKEIHGLGPVSLYDTAGVDEKGALGKKKKDKVLGDLKECDLVLIVIDPSSGVYSPERELLEAARKLNKQVLVIYNIFKESSRNSFDKIESDIRVLKFYKKISICAVEEYERMRLLNFILENFRNPNKKTELLPFIKSGEFYVLVIVMDEEAPEGRLLRPQSMIQEYITRHRAWPVCYRLDLDRARSGDALLKEKEKRKFREFISALGKKPHAVIGDSQAVEYMHDWLEEDIELSTFSIVMINYFSRGRLRDFAKGTAAIDGLKSGDRVLIAEACNHSRIAEDIGTVKIPRLIKKYFSGVKVDHSFGREFKADDEISDYSLIIHCGGCMISSQKLQARLRDIESAGVPYTNYGLFLSYVSGRNVLERVLRPWKIKYDEGLSEKAESY